MSEVLTKQLNEALEAIDRLRSEGAHLHSITNTVAQNFTANVLLACCGSVSMTANPEEIRHFIADAAALHINLGTLDPERENAILAAVANASEHGLPVLLDPVMVNVSPLRLKLARSLISNVTILKANHSETHALGLSKPSLCVVETGETDIVRFEGQVVSVANGSPLLATTIATGCALGALIATLASKTENPASASLAGLLWFSVAGEIAGETTKGPGSFAPAFLDALSAITTDTICERARVQ